MRQKRHKIALTLLKVSENVWLKSKQSSNKKCWSNIIEHSMLSVLTVLNQQKLHNSVITCSFTLVTYALSVLCLIVTLVTLALSVLCLIVNVSDSRALSFVFDCYVNDSLALCFVFDCYVNDSRALCFVFDCQYVSDCRALHFCFWLSVR